MLKMAIMGAGSIANKMADTITKMNDVKAYWKYLTDRLKSVLHTAVTDKYFPRPVLSHTSERNL